MARTVYGATFGLDLTEVQKSASFSGTAGADAMAWNFVEGSLEMAWNFVVTQVYEPCNKAESLIQHCQVVRSVNSAMQRREICIRTPM